MMWVHTSSEESVHAVYFNPRQQSCTRSSTIPTLSVLYYTYAATQFGPQEAQRLKVEALGSS